MDSGKPLHDTIDYSQIPRGPWQQRAYLLTKVLPAVVEANTRYVEEQYRFKDRILVVRDFVSHDMLDAARGDWDALSKVWFFPWVEAASELDLALTHTIAGLYRASFDHQRRAVELVIVGSVFVADATPRQEGQRWMSSADLTPMFTRALDSLATHDFYGEYDDRSGWIGRVRDHYWSLCDVVHVRGTRYALGRIQPMSWNFNGMRVPQFDSAAAQRALDYIIQTSEHVAIALALANPVLLFGLPLEEKFGLNGPVSGFFREEQAERLRLLISADLLGPLIELADADPKVVALRQWVESMPDLSEEEWQQQIEEQNKLFGRGDA